MIHYGAHFHRMFGEWVRFFLFFLMMEYIFLVFVFMEYRVCIGIYLVLNNLIHIVDVYKLNIVRLLGGA